MGGNRADFFISYAGADRAWAEWIAWQLTDGGYTVELAAWDWSAGRNVVLATNDAPARCDRVLALFSGSAPTTRIRWRLPITLAWALRDLGRCAEARGLDEDTLVRYRRALGEGHPDTLTSANNLAVVLTRLGEHHAARELAEDTLARRRRVIGRGSPRHPALGE